MSADEFSADGADDAGRQWWMPEDLAVIRARADLIPAVTRPLFLLQIDWLEADRRVQAATVTGDPARIAAAEYDRTMAAGAVLAEKTRLADAVAAVFRVVGQVSPGILDDLVLDGLAGLTKRRPQALLNALEPYLATTVRTLVEPSLIFLSKEISALKGQVGDLDEVVAATHAAGAGGCP